MRVRRARRSDALVVARLVRALNRQQGDPASRNIAAALLRDGLGPKRFVGVFVAELEGKIVGYAVFTRAYETSFATRGFYLNDLYIVPARRRHGIGRALIAAIVQEGSRTGATFLWWASRPWNQEAHRFYASLGARMEPVFAHALTHQAFRTLASTAKSVPNQKRNRRSNG
jgi:GNAT superfamily N-acetyltransferase